MDLKAQLKWWLNVLLIGLNELSQNERPLQKLAILHDVYNGVSTVCFYLFNWTILVKCTDTGLGLLGHTDLGLLGHIGLGVLGHIGLGLLLDTGRGLLGHIGRGLLGHIGLGLLGHTDRGLLGHIGLGLLVDTGLGLFSVRDDTQIMHRYANILGGTQISL